MESGDRFGVEWAAPSTRSVNGELTGFRIKYKERHDKGSITRAVPPDSNHFLLEGNGTIASFSRSFSLIVSVPLLKCRTVELPEIFRSRGTKKMLLPPTSRRFFLLCV